MPASGAKRPDPDGGDGKRCGLDTAWERRTARTAVITSVAIFLGLSLLALVLAQAGMASWLVLPFAVAIAGAVYSGMTRKIRRRRAILGQPFPPEWGEVLQREVVFYRTLEPAEQERFRCEVQVFIGEKRITGIKTDVDTTTLVLTAASAVIPIFGFPQWEWDQIDEVLIYPSRFDRDFDLGEGMDHRTLGMVGTGYMNRLMILSKPDLIRGFRSPGDKRNVGVHEFAHLVDKTDGTIDGLPTAGLDRESVGPWIELVRHKMEEIRSGDSDIDPYALTNEAEFFAVASEYFFERPGVMERKHPELYAMLSRIFNQGLGARAADIAREIKRGRPRFGRNSPCPCGSGKKYKKCCLRRSRRAS
jgi:Mlc titration factor MtfA (ptsG expression regulator)